MTRDPQPAADHSGFSPRVRPMFVVMVKNLVKAEFGYPIRDGEALDLTGYHSLGDAIGSIKQRLEINKQFPDPKLRLTLAVQEAAILAVASPANSAHAQEAILRARAAAFAALEELTKERVKYRKAQADIRERMAKIKTWGRGYARFIARMESLYNDRISELRSLNLPADVLAEATHELTEIFAIGIEN